MTNSQIEPCGTGGAIGCATAGCWPGAAAVRGAPFFGGAGTVPVGGAKTATEDRPGLLWRRGSADTSGAARAVVCCGRTAGTGSSDAFGTDLVLLCFFLRR